MVGEVVYVVMISDGGMEWIQGVYRDKDFANSQADDVIDEDVDGSLDDVWVAEWRVQ